MGFFSRKAGAAKSQRLGITSEELQQLGWTAFGGESVHPLGLAAIPREQLDGYALAFLERAGYPATGSPAHEKAITDLLDELGEAIVDGGDWASVGALLVAWNIIPAGSESPAYLEIVDRALETLRRDGVAYPSVPDFAMDRWTSLHGFDGLRPMGWPSALASIPTPEVDDDPPMEDLKVGEFRKLAQAPAAPQNTVNAERRADGSIHAVFEGVDPESGQLRRWDWDVSTPEYPAFLRELGGRLATHSHWAHDDLIPYFPCRLRSRDELRNEARAYRVT